MGLADIEREVDDRAARLPPNAKSRFEARFERSKAEREAIDDCIESHSEALGLRDEEGAESHRAQNVDVSEDFIAEAFSRRHRDDARYCAAWGKWLLWDGTRWQVDDRLRAFDLARTVCRDVLRLKLLDRRLTDRQRDSLKQRLGSAQTVAAVLKLAASDPRHAVRVDELDADPWLLSTPGGVVDLRTGSMLPHDPKRLITKITAAGPGGSCPLFLRFLNRVQPDPEVRGYLQRLLGSSLVGLVRDHVLPFMYGGGRNGKSTLAHIARYVLGDYALEIAAEVLMEAHSERHPTELAQLRGARLVIGSEVDSGRRWNESRIKRLTGGDPISARYIGRDFFEFIPSHSLVIVGNSKPGLVCVDEAIRARLHLVPFGVTLSLEEMDGELPEKLKGEASGILRWMIEGCLDWQQDGLQPPEIVVSATASYLAGEDSVAGWIADNCETHGQVTLKAAHASYSRWCSEQSRPALGRNQFADALEARGFARSTDSRNKGVVFAGLSIRVDGHWSDL